MYDLFEIDDLDLAGRIGRIRTRRGPIETPALLPVIHPYNQIVGVEEITRIGFQAVMTNAYITMKKYGSEARSRGIHEIIGFDGPIMTDSGGYQVLEYGEIESNPLAMARFEEDIGSDLAIILDTPTGGTGSREEAENTVKLTLGACKETLDGLKNRSSIWIGPVQGGKFLDLVHYSARATSKMDFDMYALGSPTVVMESYNFTLLAKMILAAKTALPPSKPFHLFGLGHPLPLSMAVALGCDTFDSASYILYAKDGRYITDAGTRDIQELVALPCSCPVCISYSAKDICESQQRTILLARHNLHILWKEVQATKQAIREGRLWDYVGAKARAHPNMWSAFNCIAKNWDYFEKFTPLTKTRGIFISSSPDDLQPIVQRYDQRFDWITPKRTVIVLPDNGERPFLLSSVYSKVAADLSNDFSLYYMAIPFGLIPVEISDVYPFSQIVVADDILDDPVLAERVASRTRNQLKSIKPAKLVLVVDTRATEQMSDFLLRTLKPEVIVKIDGEEDLIQKIKPAIRSKKVKDR
jgi:7-cyano-7-deazaguanine tRNA-ribosyltransferase